MTVEGGTAGRTPAENDVATEADVLKIPTIEFRQPEQRHAWRKLAGFLVRDTINKMFKSKQDLVIVDACSSLPVFERMTDTTLNVMAIHRAERALGKFLDITNDNKKYRDFLTEDERERIDKVSKFIDPDEDPQEMAAIRSFRSSFLQDRGSHFRLLLSSAMKDIFKGSAVSLPPEEVIEEMLRARSSFYHIEDQVIKASEPVTPEPESVDETPERKRLREIRKMIDGVLGDREETPAQQREEKAHIRAIREIDTDGVTPENEFDNALWELRQMSSPLFDLEHSEVARRFLLKEARRKKPFTRSQTLSVVDKLKKEVADEAQGYRADLADIFFKSLSRYVAQEFDKYRRNWVTVSMDIDGPEVIKEEARKCFPQTTLITDLFHDAYRMDKNNHVVGDIYDVPLLPGTVDLFTVIEGWPFYHRNPDRRYDYKSWIADEIAAAEHIYTMLAPDGQAVFFPWQSADENKDHLSAILNRWQSMGAEVTLEEITREQIIEFTKKDENPRLQSRSTIFGKEDQQVYQIVRVKKPNPLPSPEDQAEAA